MLSDILPDEALRAEEVYKKHTAAFDEVSQQIELALSLIPSAESDGLRITRTRDLNRPAVLVVMALLAKMIKTTRAIQRVCAGGLGEDSVALLRVQFETMVAIAWLLQKSTKRRIQLYLAFTQVNGLKTLNSWKSTKGLKRRAPKKLIAAYETQIGAIASRLKVPATTLRDAVKRHWSGLGTFEEVLRKLRSAGTYQTMYRYASPFSHVGDMAEHIQINGTLNVVPHERRIAATLRTASFQLWWVVHRIDERFGLDRRAQIEAIKPTVLSQHEAKRAARRRRAKPSTVSS